MDWNLPFLNTFLLQGRVSSFLSFRAFLNILGERLGHYCCGAADGCHGLNDLQQTGVAVIDVELLPEVESHPLLQGILAVALPTLGLVPVIEISLHGPGHVLHVEALAAHRHCWEVDLGQEFSKIN